MNNLDTPRESVLRTFRREPVSKIVWQPRIYSWYYANRLPNRVPEGYQGRSALNYYYRTLQPYEGPVPHKYRRMSMIEVYDDLHSSPRYSPEVLGIPVLTQPIDRTKVGVSVRFDGPDVIIRYDTPRGTLREVFRYGRHIEHPIKGPDDMKAMCYLLEHTGAHFDADAFQAADRAFGDRGVVHGYLPRTPLQRLIIQYLGFEATVYALVDYPRQTLDLMKAIEVQDDQVYEVVGDSPLEIINFGENIDASLDSPRLFREHLLPYYERRLDQLHRRGKFCHIHMDGALKPLLPFIGETAFDGIEAVTPVPQGDVTLEEIKEALGDKILLDGIPALYFLPGWPREELEACVRKVLELFSPNLILGISDELPPPGEIERVRLVADMVDEFTRGTNPGRPLGRHSIGSTEDSAG